MLSGIRTGKKKKRAQPSGSAARTDSKSPSAGLSDNSAVDPSSSSMNNLSAAERLKEALARGTPPSSINLSPTSYMDRLSSKNAAMSTDAGEESSRFVVLDGFGSSVTVAGGNITKSEEDMTATELAAKERMESGMSWNEHMARNVVRVGKKRKLKEKNASVDSDEEVEQLRKHMPDNSIKKSSKQAQKEQQRLWSRQITQYQQHEKITSMCSWWINSSNFTKDRLLAFGKHVSLMMAPLNASLEPGHQYYLVPLKHASSFVDCDDQGVIEEVALFRRSLENMYAKDRKGIVLVETVLPNKGFWQTKMEVIPVTFSALQDCPMFFRSSMIEQADEFGTHNKLLKTSVEKPLKSVIPKKFPYFYIDWGNIATSSSTGYAQIIESSNFRHDFGLDTLAGMLELDPIRFQRKRTFPPDMERKSIAEFQSKWKAHDWTTQLEDE